jgi:hypothetical protein
LGAIAVALYLILTTPPRCLVTIAAALPDNEPGRPARGSPRMKGSAR